MQSAPIPQTLQDVRPVVRNMRPEGYVLQTGGSATRKEIRMEGSQKNPLFRVTGIPLHTHNATALLEVEMSMIHEPIDEARRLSEAGEFSVDALDLGIGDFVEAYNEQDDLLRDTFNLQRAIEFGIGTVQLQPENSVNFISEPTRAIAEIRTLVSANDALKTMTFVDKTFAYMNRKGVGIDINFPPEVFIPILPVNNMHVESKFASRLLSDTTNMMHLEFWKSGVDQAGMNPIYSPKPFNDWDRPSNSYVALKNEAGDANMPYSVAYIKVGYEKKVQVKLKGATVYTDWDGRVPYVYDNALKTYVFDGPVDLRFQGEFQCINDGSIHEHLYRAGGAGSADQQKAVNIKPNQGLDYISFSITRLPHAVSKSGFFYVNGSDFSPERLGRHKDRFHHPRLIVEGHFRTEELDAATSLPPEAGFATTNFRAANTQEAVYKDDFQRQRCAWHAPIVRWPVGSDVALSGPLLSKLNLPDAIAAEDWDEPAGGVLKAYASGFEAVANVAPHKPLSQFAQHTITNAVTHFEPLLRIEPSSRTPLIQAANGDLDEKIDEANALWTQAFPVSVRAGMYPFPDDHCFQHRACQGIGAVSGQIAEDVTELDSKEYNMHIQFGTQGDIIRAETMRIFWTLGPDPTQGDSAALLGVVGNTGNLTNVLANIVSKKAGVTKGYVVGVDWDDAQRAFEERLNDGNLGVGEMAMSMVWCSEFLINTQPNVDNKRICPCELVVANPHVEYDAPAGSSTVDIVFEVDQYPFFRTAFDRPGVAYRGGYHTNTLQIASADPAYTEPARPAIGNIFAYGADPGASVIGGVASVRTGGDVDMYVQVLRRGTDPKNGTLRVTGLAFAKKLQERTLFFFYGGVAGNAGTIKKEFMWSEPTDVRKTELDVEAVVGDGSAAIVQQCWVTDIHVRSHINIVEKANTKVVNGDVHTHLYMAVVAPRSQGLFNMVRHTPLALTESTSLSTGHIYAPHFVVTQPLSAPLLNADFRNGCIEPLDQMTAFLPPELRDFQIMLGDIDWRHTSDNRYKVEVKRLLFSEFNGGNQQVASIPSLLSVPEFRQYTVNVSGPGRIEPTSDFDTEIFTPMGPPCFWCLFARRDDSPNAGLQPMIDNLTFTCVTTGKKSDTISEAGKAELFFMTRRNCHKRAWYTDEDFRQRQVILLRSEDVGTMGINPRLYQREKRTRYRIQGTTHWATDNTINIVLVYTNRGLQITGKEISVQYL